jgi:hypothetical protein
MHRSIGWIQHSVLALAIASCGTNATDESGSDDTFTCTDCPIVLTQDPIQCSDPGLREQLGAFESIEIAGISLQDFPDGPDTTLASGLSAGDLNGDGLIDIVLPHAGLPQLLIQQEDGSFVDEAPTRWPDGVDGGSAAHVIDINGDGHLDVFMCTGPIPLSGIPAPMSNRLYLNDGSGNLTDVSDEWGIGPAQFRFCFTAAFGDIDGDDDLDMALATNEVCGPPNPNGGEVNCDYLLEYDSSRSLWEQQDGAFVDISSRLPKQQTLSSFSHVSTLIDIDGDQDLDLYLTNDAKAEISFSNNNALFLNDGKGQFDYDEANALGLNIRIAGMGIGVGDLNDDALPDLFMSGTSGVYLMMSSPDYWYEASQAAGLSLESGSNRIEGWATELADLDNDGDLDAPMMFGALVYNQQLVRMPDALFLNRGDQTFDQVAEDWGLDDEGMGRGLLTVDVNGDGWLDLLKRELGGTLRYYQARCGSAAWSKIDLEQPGLNPQAIGSVIEVSVGETKQRRWVLGGGTSLSSNGPTTQHFGLGDAEEIDRIKVTWPDGKITSYTSVPVNIPIKLER